MSLFKRNRKPPAQDPSSIGNLLLQQRLITEQQLQEILDFQKEKKDLLGELCVAKGLCSREQVELAYLRQRMLRKEKVDYAQESGRLLDNLSHRVRSIGNAFDEVRDQALKVVGEEAQAANGRRK
jgi:hypothetical protein